eukprot:Gregarina_sp_Poly_1__4825@NODE_256_length_10541_cov_633_466679_g223_i0_p7_GENE_NODE_256_length_10541_cov_633_466679_g223_i0NODE_256_length_10541_cov_633_466679_g223_i0_p7_ORF_typecomplete_len173_score13_54_NODE_256_length_10541_cov_633_466679_g223_i041414659
MNFRTMLTVARRLTLVIQESEQFRCLQWWSELCDCIFKNKLFELFTQLHTIVFDLEPLVEIKCRASTGRLPSTILFKMICCFPELRTVEVHTNGENSQLTRASKWIRKYHISRRSPGILEHTLNPTTPCGADASSTVIKAHHLRGGKVIIDLRSFFPGWKEQCNPSFFPLIE